MIVIINENRKEMAFLLFILCMIIPAFKSVNSQID